MNILENVLEVLPANQNSLLMCQDHARETLVSKAKKLVIITYELGIAKGTPTFPRVTPDYGWQIIM